MTVVTAMALSASSLDGGLYLQNQGTAKRSAQLASLTCSLKDLRGSRIRFTRIQPSNCRPLLVGTMGASENCLISPH
jgi:hypothetical protein